MVPDVICAVRWRTKRSVLCTIESGIGLNGTLMVRNTTAGLVTTNRNLRISFVSDTLLSCGYTTGMLCSTHGLCNYTTGECRCHQSPAFGYWSGPLCGECTNGYSGSTCRQACPSTAGVTCSARGQCIAGTCNCGIGFGGTTCELSCPNAQGTCSPSGLCICRAGYGGILCDVS